MFLHLISPYRVLLQFVDLPIRTSITFGNPFWSPSVRPALSTSIHWGASDITLGGVSVRVTAHDKHIVADLMWHTGPSPSASVYHRLFLINSRHNVVQLSHSRQFYDTSGMPIPTSTWPSDGCIITRTVAEVPRLEGEYELYIQLPTSDDDRSQRLNHAIERGVSMCKPFVADRQAACLGFLFEAKT